jgi:hypothetical protein
VRGCHRVSRHCVIRYASSLGNGLLELVERNAERAALEDDSKSER